jgi:hypothetical protein
MNKLRRRIFQAEYPFFLIGFLLRKKKRDRDWLRRTSSFGNKSS